MSSRQADYGFYLAQYHDACAIVAVAVGDATTKEDVIAAKSSRHTIFVQRIIMSVTTDAAQSLTFQDDNGTAYIIGKSPASPGLGIEIVADFGPKGIPLTQGKNLDVVISGAGLVCKVSIEAYQRVTAVSNTL